MIKTCLAAGWFCSQPLERGTQDSEFEPYVGWRDDIRMKSFEDVFFSTRQSNPKKEPSKRKDETTKENLPSSRTIRVMPPCTC